MRSAEAIPRLTSLGNPAMPRTLPRRVEPEWLDQLPAGDPDAIRSRRDLQRLNRLMGHVDSLARLLRRGGLGLDIQRLVDLGAGDGTLLLSIARRLAPSCGHVRAILVDRQELVSAATREAFGELDWEIEVVAADVLDWLAGARPGERTMMVANLFLHHFAEAPLRALLGRVAESSEAFAACEPHRSRFVLAACRWMGWIGCNSVTRHDGAISVRAGFTAREISDHWPKSEAWRLDESPAGLFSHLFMARWRVSPTSSKQPSV